VTRNQTLLAAFLLMVGVIAADAMLSRVLSAEVSLAVVSFSFVLSLMWLLDRSPIRQWPRSTFGHKVVVAGIMAIAPYALRKLGL
jgi:hypothetical protein